MADYAFPSGLMPATVEVTPTAAQAVTRSPFSYKGQVFDYGGRMLRLAITMQDMDATDAATFGAFFKSLDGMAKTFSFNVDPWAPGMSYGTRTFRLASNAPTFSTSRPVTRFAFEAVEEV